MGRLDGEPVACISVVRYGADFGFLGCYIARPAVRGKGYGIQIWNAGMQRLAGRNIGLDGVVAQQGNYRKSGFRLAWNNSATKARRAAAAPPPACALVDARSVPFDRLAAYDRRFFPEPRDSFLAPWITLPERAALVALRDGEIAGFGVIRAAGRRLAHRPALCRLAGDRRGAGHGACRRHAGEAGRPSTCPIATRPDRPCRADRPRARLRDRAHVHRPRSRDRSPACSASRAWSWVKASVRARFLQRSYDMLLQRRAGADSRRMESRAISVS